MDMGACATSREVRARGADARCRTSCADSPASFNPDLYFDSLAATASLPDLLRKENELINGASRRRGASRSTPLTPPGPSAAEIRELDGERQSLVYNHHSELIDASETIKKMKSRALALDASLDSLKTSFQSISQLSTSLASTSSTSTTLDPTLDPKTPPRRTSASQTTPSHAKRLSTLLETPTQPGTQFPAPVAKAVFDPLVHLPMLLSLPLLLRHSDKKAELWGQWEPALRSWEEEGIMGVKEVGNECREALREVRRNSVSSRGGLVD